MASFELLMNEAWGLLTEEKLEILKEKLAEIKPNSEKEYFDLEMLKGYYFWKLANFNRSASHFKNLEKHANNLKRNDLLGIAFHQQAFVLREEKQYLKALALIEKEKQLIDDYFSGDFQKLAINSYEQGYLRLLMGNIKEAKEWLDSSLKYSLMTEDLIAIGCSYRALGELELRKENKLRAEKNLNLALSYFERENDLVGVAQIKKMLEDISK